MTAKSVVLGTTLRNFFMSHEILKHINNSFHVDLSETLEALQARISGLVVQQPIWHLVDAVIQYKFNVCKKWFASIPKHQNHTKNNLTHLNEIGYDIKPQLCILLFQSRSKQSLMVQNSLFMPFNTRVRSCLLTILLTPLQFWPLLPIIQNLWLPQLIFTAWTGTSIFLTLRMIPPSFFHSMIWLALHPENWGRHLAQRHLSSNLRAFFRDLLTQLMVSFSTKETFSLLANTTTVYQVPATQALTFAFRYVLLDQECSEHLDRFELMQLRLIWKCEQSKLVFLFLETLLSAKDDLPDKRFLIQAFSFLTPG